MFRKGTQTYKHTPAHLYPTPSPPPFPPFTPKEREGLVPPQRLGGRGGAGAVGWEGGGVCSHICVNFRNANKETVSTLAPSVGRERGNGPRCHGLPPPLPPLKENPLVCQGTSSAMERVCRGRPGRVLRSLQTARMHRRPAHGRRNR